MFRYGHFNHDKYWADEYNFKYWANTEYNYGNGATDYHPIECGTYNEDRSDGNNCYCRGVIGRGNCNYYSVSLLIPNVIRYNTASVSFEKSEKKTSIQTNRIEKLLDMESPAT